MEIAVISLLGVGVFILWGILGLLGRILDCIKFLRDYIMVKQHVEDTIGKAIKPPAIGLN